MIKKILFTFVCTISFSYLLAQQAYECVYVPANKTCRLLSDSISYLTDDGEIYRFVLITSNTYSFYYNFLDNTAYLNKKFQNEEPRLDTLREWDSAGNHYATTPLIVPALMRSDDTGMVIYKDLIHQREYFSYKKHSRLVDLYSDTLFPMKWNLIADADRDIGSLHCKKATTYFRGREITVWYCPDIPIPDGPWKLGGLPGLIVSWTDPALSDDFTIVLKRIHPVNFPNALKNNIITLEKMRTKDYPSYVKDVVNSFNKKRIELQRIHQNCVDCKTTDKVKLSASFHLRFPLENISLDADL